MRCGHSTCKGRADRGSEKNYTAKGFAERSGVCEHRTALAWPCGSCTSTETVAKKGDNIQGRPTYSAQTLPPASPAGG